MLGIRRFKNLTIDLYCGCPEEFVADQYLLGGLPPKGFVEEVDLGATKVGKLATLPAEKVTFVTELHLPISLGSLLTESGPNRHLAVGIESGAAIGMGPKEFCDQMLNSVTAIADDPRGLERITLILPTKDDYDIAQELLFSRFQEV